MFTPTAKEIAIREANRSKLSASGLLNMPGDHKIDFSKTVSKLDQSKIAKAKAEIYEIAKLCGWAE